LLIFQKHPIIGRAGRAVRPVSRRVFDDTAGEGVLRRFSVKTIQSEMANFVWFGIESTVFLVYNLFESLCFCVLKYFVLCNMHKYRVFYVCNNLGGTT